MGEISDATCRPGIGLNILLLVATVVAQSGCSGHGGGPASAAAAASAQTSSQATNNEAQGMQVAVSPPLSPSFDPSIHDYVIDCNSSPGVQFTAYFPAGQNLRLLDPNGSVTSTASSAGTLQDTFALKAGQRFRLLGAASADVYSVRCLPGDFPPLQVAVNGSRAAEWYLFTPTLSFSSTRGSYVIITDANGTPVWWMSDPIGTPLDAKILPDGAIVWTHETPFGAGGEYVIRSFGGEIQNTLTGNIDQHDLQVTATGTFLSIRDVQRVCPPDCADMSAWGGNPHSPVIDAEIVEQNAHSDVLWTWRTRDHIALSEAGNSGWFTLVGNDIIHMNAVEPDGVDGLIFSARHLNAIYHVTKSSGAIDWKIGGTARPESLVVIGDTRPTAIGATGMPLSGQHDVRRWVDGTISVHDNGSIANRGPFVVRYQIDTDARTAEVVELFTDPRVASSQCCGSARRLLGGNWLVSWGAQPFMTEFDSTGTAVFTIDYNLGSVFSYRAVPILPGQLSAAVLRTGMDAMAVR